MYGFKQQRAMSYSAQKPMQINIDSKKVFWGGGGVALRA